VTTAAQVYRESKLLDHKAGSRRAQQCSTAKATWTVVRRLPGGETTEPAGGHRPQAVAWQSRL